MKNSHTSIERKGTIAVLLIIGLIVAYVAVSETLSRPSGENLKPSAAIETKSGTPEAQSEIPKGETQKKKKDSQSKKSGPKKSAPQGTSRRHLDETVD